MDWFLYDVEIHYERVIGLLCFFILSKFYGKAYQKTGNGAVVKHAAFNCRKNLIFSLSISRIFKGARSRRIVKL